jgi:ferric-dicitrate binding protein FerR (iron transport regulator)
MRGDAAVEALLEHAAPRPTPPRDDAIAVRNAVHTEWQAVTGRLRRRQRLTFFAVAATVLLGVVIAFDALQPDYEPAVQVATISKSHGSIYLLGEQSEQTEMTNLSAISAGQVILTGDDAGIGLEWGNGGSLRVDKNTHIEFTSAESVYLRSGQVYFDSHNDNAADGTGPDFTIETDHGTVRHLGTQYMTLTDATGLTVRVREGQVELGGAYSDAAVANAGQQMTVSGGSRPSVIDFKIYGEVWDWVEQTAPGVNVDGRSVDEFLAMVSRETGLQIAYESAAAEELAHKGVLKGNVDMEPRDELAFRMSGEDLGYRIDGGTIYVSSIESIKRP